MPLPQPRVGSRGLQAGGPSGLPNVLHPNNVFHSRLTSTSCSLFIALTPDSPSLPVRNPSYSLPCVGSFSPSCRSCTSPPRPACCSMSHQRKSKVRNAALPTAVCLQALASEPSHDLAHLLSVCRVDTLKSPVAPSPTRINMKPTGPQFEAPVAPPVQTH